jgi:hypothetical protein
LDHGEGGQLNIAGRSWREDGERRPEKEQLPGETTNPMSVARMPVLAADAEWRGYQVISLRE